MNRKIYWITLVLMALAFILSANSLVAQRGMGGRGMLHSQLTDDQRTQLHETMSDLRADGATREEIQAEVALLFTSWGIEMPNRPQMRGNRAGGNRMGGRGNFQGIDLTDAQRAELNAKRDEMRAAGASREEIHEAITALFASWGIEPPQYGPGRGFSGRMGGKGNFQGLDLTDAQRAELTAKRDELRAAGASREEIHEAMAALFTSWGIEPPQYGPGRGFAGRMGRGGAFIDGKTTVELRIDLYKLHDTMWANGATRDEMRTAAHALLNSWGIQPPDTTGRRGFHGRGEHWQDQLTQQQRVEVRAKVKEMKIAGKSREETHTAIAEIVKGFGIEMPDQPRFGRGGRGHRGYGDAPELSDEQRATLYATMQDLRAAGATRQEMRDARKALLAEWGVGTNENPQNEPVREGKRGKRNGIQARNYPNPFNPETNITYTLENAGPVKVSIFNLQGQELRVLVNSTQSSGDHTVRWDGKLANGESAGSGTYIYRIEAGGIITNSKMILMK
ncbi:MAG: T9SS C-terminal target domain-containing protein [Calditrichaeota bacterium]|nr:MAG: T9SS C-terminal target domain-containing protein [Calditrichota bacterium]